MNENIESSENERVAENCSCLPACTAISYDVESSQILSYADKYFNELFDTKELKLDRIEATIVNIQFKEAQFFNSKRNELYAWGDFVASCHLCQLLKSFIT
jgi:acid-sensing ion channel, other